MTVQLFVTADSEAEALERFTSAVGPVIRVVESTGRSYSTRETQLVPA